MKTYDDLIEHFRDAGDDAAADKLVKIRERGRGDFDIELTDLSEVLYSSFAWAARSNGGFKYWHKKYIKMYHSKI